MKERKERKRKTEMNEERQKGRKALSTAGYEGNILQEMRVWKMD